MKSYKQLFHWKYHFTSSVSIRYMTTVFPMSFCILSKELFFWIRHLMRNWFLCCQIKMSWRVSIRKNFAIKLIYQSFMTLKSHWSSLLLVNPCYICWGLIVYFWYFLTTSIGYLMVHAATKMQVRQLNGHTLYYHIC